MKGLHDREGGLLVMLSMSSLMARVRFQSLTPSLTAGGDGQSSPSSLTTSGDGRRRRWGWGGHVSLPSTLWVGGR